MDAIARHHDATVAQLRLANGEIKLDKKGRLIVRRAGDGADQARQRGAPIKVAQGDAVAGEALRASARGARTSHVGEALHGALGRHALTASAQRYRNARWMRRIGLNRLTASAMIHRAQAQAP
jgi:hypothetical protein